MIFPIGLSPNTERDDVNIALYVMCRPWCWYRDDKRETVKNWFFKQFGANNVTLFISGRSALTTLLEAFNIEKGDEVIIQAFTCMVVPNAIRFAGAMPIYGDIDASANLDPKKLENKITSKTKAVIVQHTFGTPADMDAIMAIAKKHNLVVIEDCAHALGATYKGKMVGTFGDAAFFSFGRDKILSSVFGGAAIIKDSVVAQTVDQKEQKAAYPSGWWIAQQLFHPIAMSIVQPLYQSGIGKAILVVLQKLHLLSFPVSKGEYEGGKPERYMMRYPNALAILLDNQLSKLEKYTKTRRDVAAYYTRVVTKMPGITNLASRQKSAYLRFGICVDDQKAFLKKAKRHGLIFGNWYHNIIDPAGCSLDKAGYTSHSCPKAEKLAKHIVNLPTRISLQQAKEIGECIGSF